MAPHQCDYKNVFPVDGKYVGQIEFKCKKYSSPRCATAIKAAKALDW